jgi:hypothetical protein
MKTTELLDPQSWAEQTYAKARLHDLRRTKRVIMSAAQMAREPSASLPKQLPTWKEVKALYRLLDEEDVSFEALMQPHWEQTAALLPHRAVTLLVQDTTSLDLSAHSRMSGVGQVGKGNGRGLLLQTVLAVDPTSETVLGCIAQEPFVRILKPEGEQPHQRRGREKRETDVWMYLVERIGNPSPESLLVHVGDRGADMFDFFHTCRVLQTECLVRAAQNRQIRTQEEEVAPLKDHVRAWKSQGARPFQVPMGPKRQARQTILQISYGPVTLLPPKREERQSRWPRTELSIWVIRVWEEQTPADEEPLEWILLTTVETTTLSQAWVRVDWYRHRWTAEDYHSCLKTGCQVEARQVRTKDRFTRLLGFLSPLAVRLIQLRDLARQTPERLAQEVVEPEAVAVLAARRGLDPTTMTAETFWCHVAGLGGFLARRSDGQPGWKTLWKGWLELQTLLEGVHLAFHLRL